MTESPSVRRRLLGSALRRHREAAGYNLQDAAEMLECDRSKLSRIETGQRGIRPKELRELLTEFGVADQEMTALVAIAGGGRKTHGWWAEFGEALPALRREFFALEMAATRIQVYEPRHIPDLLQTAEYAAVVADAGLLETREVSAEVTLARQRAILKERQPHLAVVIDEAALRRAVGGPEVMRDQLDKLAGAAGDAQGVTIQVMPFTSGVPAMGISGPATVLRFTNAPGSGVVYLPLLGHSGACLIERAEVASYSAAFTELTKAALTVPESARLLRRRAAETAAGWHGGDGGADDI